MESLKILGLIHTYGALLWIIVIPIITLNLFRVLEKEERGKNHTQWSVKLTLLALITSILMGSTGLVFLYEWEIWNSIKEGDLWWTHSMILSWILFSFVFFMLDPLLLKRLE
ncbi:hypothetical protein [Salinimicrobium sediminilitoris]|uniref:hypothetical protein n=1 Tax=Salinimicrobium sediminilitoris TaxID=2876715 RepID=UPI001E61FB76|nr:hypothetical protein [Salinimicrobium sediminilitoris]MCC8358335.1 hypothetical protein [Salinimicrobium sediminilitoris]